jgi:hypothetical protein
VWFNLGSAVLLPEVLLKAVSVVRNFGHDLDGRSMTLTCARYCRCISITTDTRPSSESYQLLGQHEIILPLLHAAVACRLAGFGRQSAARQGVAA